MLHLRCIGLGIISNLEIISHWKCMQIYKNIQPYGRGSNILGVWYLWGSWIQTSLDADRLQNCCKPSLSITFCHF